jgi:Mg2+-importing ATPase
MESLVSATIIVLVVRTRRPFFRSRPSSYLLVTTLLVAAAGLALPFTWLGELFGFVALPPAFVLAVGVIVALYVGAAELAKKAFYGKTTP